MIPDPPDASANAPGGLARSQFIQREFAEFLGGFDPTPEGPYMARFQWIQDRLFADQWSPEEIRQALAAADTRGRIIAVTSGKGGVGKTTVSVNLAVALALSGCRTLLFDGDFGMGNVHVFAGINPSVTILDVLDGRVGIHDAVVEGPAGLKVICGASGASRIACIDRRQLEELARQIFRLATDFDVVVLDTGAGIGREVLSLLSLADEIMVVTTPNLASTLDAYGVIKAAHEANVSGAFGVLANQARTEEEANAVRDRLVSCAARFLERSVHDFGWLPRAPRVEAANQSRRSIVECSRNSEVSRRFRALAATLLANSERGVSASESPPESAAA